MLEQIGQGDNKPIQLRPVTGEIMKKRKERTWKEEDVNKQELMLNAENVWKPERCNPGDGMVVQEALEILMVSIYINEHRIIYEYFPQRLLTRYKGNGNS
jgi:hypothetical protein